MVEPSDVLIGVTVRGRQAGTGPRPSGAPYYLVCTWPAGEGEQGGWGGDRGGRALPPVSLARGQPHGRTEARGGTGGQQ